MWEVIDDGVLGQLTKGVVLEMIHPVESRGLVISGYFPSILNQNPACT